LLADGVDPLPVGPREEHPLAERIGVLVVPRAQVRGDVPVQRRELVESPENAIRPTEPLERRWSVGHDRSQGDLVRVRLPVVGDHAKALLLRPPRDDRAAREHVGEGAPPAAGELDGLGDEVQQLPLVSDVGDQLREDELVSRSGGVTPGMVQLTAACCPYVLHR
jgi:hypothetical protein